MERAMARLLGAGLLAAGSVHAADRVRVDLQLAVDGTMVGQPVLVLATGTPGEVRMEGNANPWRLTLLASPPADDGTRQLALQVFSGAGEGGWQLLGAPTIAVQPARPFEVRVQGEGGQGYAISGRLEVESH